MKLLESENITWKVPKTQWIWLPTTRIWFILENLSFPPNIKLNG